jgi:hypothetical protein
LGWFCFAFGDYITRFLGSYWLNLKLDPVTKSLTPSKCKQNRLNVIIKIKTINNMPSYYSTPLKNNTIASKVLSITSGLTLPNAFSRIMGPAPIV